MAMKLGAVILDSTDPDTLAGFYAELTDWTIQSSSNPDSPYINLVNPDGGIEFGLQRVPESKTVKNRAHVDFFVEDIEREAKRAVELGATLVRRYHEEGEGWIWMTDPEGNEFCFCNACGSPS